MQVVRQQLPASCLHGRAAGVVEGAAVVPLAHVRWWFTAASAAYTVSFSSARTRANAKPRWRLTGATSFSGCHVSTRGLTVTALSPNVQLPSSFIRPLRPRHWQLHCQRGTVLHVLLHVGASQASCATWHCAPHPSFKVC